MSQGVLDGVRIVDLAGSNAGSIAGMAATMLLAEIGADVVLVEPPSLAIAAAWNFGDLDVRLELAPPLLGEHTVLLEVGLDQRTIDELLAVGAALQHGADHVE